MAKKKPLHRFHPNNYPIAARIASLIIVATLLIGILGALATFALNRNVGALEDTNQRVARMNLNADLINRINSDYRVLLYEVDKGLRAWDDGHHVLRTTKPFLIQDLKDYAASLDVRQRADAKELPTLIDAFSADIDRAMGLMSVHNPAALDHFLANDMAKTLDPLLSTLLAVQASDVDTSRRTLASATGNANRYLRIALLLSLFGLAAMALLGYLVYQSITRPTTSLMNTVKMLSIGEFSARAPVKGRDELAHLGQALNQLLDDRVATMEQVEQNHEQLNASVFSLLQAVSELSDRNLTVRATVTEDATGPLADAINQLAEDTTEVLAKVRDVARSVERSANELSRHAQEINKVAAAEQAEAEKTALELEAMSKRFDNIAGAAQIMNATAEKTATTTRHAHESVSRTLESMLSMRDQTLDTGKRIKQLGERSQEITHIVDVINTIAERTTVLALNASMQAAAAGEAGRGFSVVAEEIQRLAENSRDSTNQIATLVRNIQLETNETMRTMDKTIEQVSEGSRLAKSAGQEMEQAQASTSRLVNEVAQISNASIQLSRAGKTLQARARRIVNATRSTGERLLKQARLIDEMVGYARQLVQSVGIFKLGD